MNNIKEFNRNPISLPGFWRITGPSLAAILLLTVIIVLWRRPTAESFRAYIKWRLGLSPRKGIGYPKEQGTMMTKPKLRAKKEFPWSRREKIRDPPV